MKIIALTTIKVLSVGIIPEGDDADVKDEEAKILIAEGLAEPVAAAKTQQK